MLQIEKHFSKKEKILGQYFTPIKISNLVTQKCLNYINKNIKEIKAIDPTCGDGSFLKALEATNVENYLGYDIDENVKNLIPEHIKNKIEIKNSIFLEEDNTFDLVVGNPPYSSKYNRISDLNILKLFDLGINKKTQAIEILFIEKSIKILKKEGILGLVLPIGILTNLNLEYVRNYLLQNLEIKEIIYLHPTIFKNNNASTFILIAKKVDNPNNLKIKFGEIKNLKNINYNVIEKEIIENCLNPLFYLNCNNVEDDYIFLEELIEDIFTGKGFYKENKKHLTTTPSDIKYFTIKNFKNNNINLENVLYLDNSLKIKEKFLLKQNDIIFCRVGQGSIGTCFLVDNNLENSIVDDWFHVIRLKNKNISQNLLNYFKTNDFIKILKTLSLGTGTPNISKQKLLKIKIPKKIIEI